MLGQGKSPKILALGSLGDCILRQKHWSGVGRGNRKSEAAQKLMHGFLGEVASEILMGPWAVGRGRKGSVENDPQMSAPNLLTNWIWRKEKQSPG